MGWDGMGVGMGSHINSKGSYKIYKKYIVAQEILHNISQ